MGAVAWVILQVADVILKNLEAPGWLFKALPFIVAPDAP